MMSRSKGFGLVEIMIALVLGLVIVAGIIQIFISTKATYQSQSVAARMQEDARFFLSKLVQEIRMAGMYGCLKFDTAVTSGAIAAPSNLTYPVLWNATANQLTLVTADVGGAGSSPTWTIISDCKTSSQLYSGTRAATGTQISFPLRQLTYALSGTQLTMKDGLAGSALPILDNVSAISISFGVTGSPMSYTTALTNSTSTSVRSVRLSLTLTDPTGTVRPQTYNVVAALRNRF